MIRFTVPGRPVPYTRMTRRGQYVKPAPKRYKAYLDVVRLYAKLEMNRSGFQFIRKGTPIEFGCKIYLKGGLDGDLSNYIKAIEDALNDVVYEDDRYIVRYIGNPEKIFVEDKSEERVEVQVRAI
jgi:crossover junction endodeoxyribonuclease RusA